MHLMIALEAFKRSFVIEVRGGKDTPPVTVTETRAEVVPIRTGFNV